MRFVEKVSEKFPFFFTFDLYLQEGANINKSLTTLGKVISALAEVVRSHTLMFDVN